jgi:hypothetical protein
MLQTNEDLFEFLYQWHRAWPGELGLPEHIIPEECQASYAELIALLECSLGEKVSLILARSGGGRSELKTSCLSLRS